MRQQRLGLLWYNLPVTRSSEPFLDFFFMCQPDCPPDPTGHRELFLLGKTVFPLHLWWVMPCGQCMGRTRDPLPLAALGRWKKTRTSQRRTNWALWAKLLLV